MARPRARDRRGVPVPRATLAGDRGAFARAVRELPDPAVRPAMFLRLDGRPTDLVTYRSVRPEASDPFTNDEEN